jgi:hypothetical protein
MAKVKGGTDGSISGMIGPVVFFRQNGNTYARKAPAKRAKNSWSDEQVMYRGKVSKLGVFWRQSTPDTVKQIFKLAAENMTGYNLFLKTNMPAFSPDGLQIDPEWFHLSAGKLPLPHKLKAVRVAGNPNQIEVTWQPDLEIGLALPTDELTVVFAHEGKFTGPIATGTQRKQQTAVIHLPAGIGPVQGVYLSFASDEQKLYSPDQYFGL